jgi:CTP:molybdopterin cytidylyltransferase MocA
MNICGVVLAAGRSTHMGIENKLTTQIGATIGTANNSHYLLDNFLLSTTVGAGPRQNIDVAAGTRCSPFKTFGTWTVTP